MAAALAEVAPADATRLAEAIGGDSGKYADFRDWARGAFGGETAVFDSAHAVPAWLIGADAPFANEPIIMLTEFNTGAVDAPSMASQLSVTVEVKDGEVVALVAAEKVATMFEATSDLQDWDGAAKLVPSVSNATRNADGTMTFAIIPGDGTATSAFLRIKVK